MLLELLMIRLWPLTAIAVVGAAGSNGPLTTCLLAGGRMVHVLEEADQSVLPRNVCFVSFLPSEF